MQGVADSRILIPERKKSRRLQAGLEQGIKAFFGGNALVAVIVLALITIFLCREGLGLFGQNLENLRLYRQAGLEYVDIIRNLQSEHEALSRKLSDIRLRKVRALEMRQASPDNITAALASFDQFAANFSDAAENLRGLVSDLTDQASGLKEQLSAVDLSSRDPALHSLREGGATFETISANLTANLYALLAAAPPLADPAAEKSFGQWKSAVRDYLARLPAASEQLREWSPDAPIPWYRSITSFLFGREWVTASFWQDWYGTEPSQCPDSYRAAQIWLNDRGGAESRRCPCQLGPETIPGRLSQRMACPDCAAQGTHRRRYSPVAHVALRR